MYNYSVKRIACPSFERARLAESVSKAVQQLHVSTEKARLAGLEEQYGNLTQVEVDEMLSLVRYIRAKVAAHNAVPSRVVFLVKLLLDVRSDVLFDVVLCQCGCGHVDSILLHRFRHVGILNDCTAHFTHFRCCA